MDPGTTLGGAGALLFLAAIVIVAVIAIALGGNQGHADG